jgi:hypothetical protein
MLKLYKNRMIEPPEWLYEADDEEEEDAYEDAKREWNENKK